MFLEHDVSTCILEVTVLNYALLSDCLCHSLSFVFGRKKAIVFKMYHLKYQ